SAHHRNLHSFPTRRSSDLERNAYLTFVIIGGGPTGVELAGMLPTIARHTLRGEFRRIDTAKARVILLEGGPRILPTFPEDLAARSEEHTSELQSPYDLVCR